MPRRLVISALVFVVAAVLVYVAGAAASPQVSLPVGITADTACPVAGCTQPDGACHAADPAPEPDGVFTMVCPKVEGCTDTSCHAWSRISTPTTKPIDASLNLWILAPVVFTVILVLIVRKMR